MPELQNDSATAPSLPENPAIPAPLLSANPLQWLRIFGPGAVVASLTIGAGELIFSTRGGALFGFHILWLFLLTLVMKWVLAYSIARHIVIWGRHPFQRWAESSLAWLPATFFLLAMISFPIWTAFHAGTVGTLIAKITSTESLFGNSTHLVWGIALLALFAGISLKGGYSLLEKAQFAIVAILLLLIAIVALKLHPDWLAVLRGMFVPQPLLYPDWISNYPDIAKRTPLLECITYVGILGGGGYDYLAYASYLRDKRWGNAAEPGTQARFDRRWLRAPLIDCTMSFVAVLIFTVVFVICGVVILGSAQKVPTGTTLLTLQSEFVTPLFPALAHLYFAGALLAMGGTLYGTIEVAPTILREFNLSRSRAALANRRTAILWVCGAGIAVLGAILAYTYATRASNPPALIAILTPANLFTGVMGCGIICLTTIASELRVPKSWRLPVLLLLANALFGLAFLLLGLRAYWDHSGWTALLILGGTVALGWAAHKLLNKS